MSMSVQPTNVPVDQSVPTPKPIVTDTDPTSAQVNAFVDNRLHTSGSNGQPNMYQMVDQMNISPQAKHALENSMARQTLNFAEGEGGQATSAQKQYVFNGSVYNAVKNLASGQGSMQDVAGAIAERGVRVQQVLAGYTPPTPVAGAPSPATGAPTTDVTV